jgi:hypothetical protein
MTKIITIRSQKKLLNKIVYVHLPIRTRTKEVMKKLKTVTLNNKGLSDWARFSELTSIVIVFKSLGFFSFYGVVLPFDVIIL